jgi:hypothetical protein
VMATTCLFAMTMIVRVVIKHVNEPDR